MQCGAWPSVPPPSAWPPALPTAPSASGTPAAAAQPASVPSPQRAVSGGDMGACGTLTGGTGAVQTEAPRGGSPPVPPVPREERGR